MGRHRKYFTAEEQSAKRRERNAKYDSSQHGKAVRTANRALRHTRRVSKHSVPRLQPLPDAVEQLALLPLPEHEYLYNEALRSPHSLDESTLNQWKKEPPFLEDASSVELPSTEYAQNLQIVLHGVRMREQQAQDHHRREAILQIGQPAYFDVLRQEVVEELETWKRVQALDVYVEGSLEYAMTQHFLQWQARTLCHLFYMQFLYE